MKLFFIVSLLFFNSILSYKINAQSNSSVIANDFSKINKDSLVTKVNYCLTIYNNYLSSDSVLANSYNKIAISILNNAKINSVKTQLYLLIIRNDLVHNEYRNTSSIRKEALEFIKNNGDSKQNAKALYYIAYYFLEYEHNYKEATTIFYDALKYAEKSKDENLLANIHNALGKLYQLVNNNDSAYTYFKLTNNYFEKVKDSFNLATVYLNLGSVSAKDKKQRDLFFEKALKISVLSKNVGAEMITLYNMANVANEDAKIEEAEFLALEVIEKAKQTQQYSILLNAKVLLADIKFDLKKYDEATTLSLEILPELRRQKNTAFEITTLTVLEKTYEQKGKYQLAYSYGKQKQYLNDSIAMVNKNSDLNEIKAKYNFEKKDKELRFKNELLILNEKTEKQKNIVIIALAVALLSICAFILIYIKQRKSQQNIKQKEKEYNTQLQNFESFINGQETERKRIASDLHDGLAQNLVMLNLELASLSSNKPDEKIIFLQDEVTKMINETRKIAHNMMPDVLIDLGLIKALKSLIFKLNENNTTIKFELKLTEPFYDIDKNTEVQLYRMSQELINNIVKHSKASKCCIIMESNSTQINLIIKDNGIGIQNKKDDINGIGFKNLLTRTHSLKGELSIESLPNEGVSVTINIPTKIN